MLGNSGSSPQLVLLLELRGWNDHVFPDGRFLDSLRQWWLRLWREHLTSAHRLISLALPHFLFKASQLLLGMHGWVGLHPHGSDALLDLENVWLLRTLFHGSALGLTEAHEQRLLICHLSVAAAFLLRRFFRLCVAQVLLSLLTEFLKWHPQGLVQSRLSRLRHRELGWLLYLLIYVFGLLFSAGVGSILRGTEDSSSNLGIKRAIERSYRAMSLWVLASCSWTKSNMCAWDSFLVESGVHLSFCNLHGQ